MESQRFIEFMKSLRASAAQPIMVIADGGSYNKSKAVKEFLKKEGDVLGIRLILLPPYSPELNPNEQVWNQAKREIGKQSLNTTKNLREAVDQTLQAIQSSVKMIQSFFRLPDTKDACAAN